MRKRLWLQFHLWTLGLVVLLFIANVASALRPYTPPSTVASGPALMIGSMGSENRSPASQDAETMDPRSAARLALKTAVVGCEANSRLRVVTAVRQLRLQFEPCAAKDTILGIKNKTNGFEATLFGSAAHASEPETMAGTFTTPESAKAAADKSKKKRAIAAETASLEKETVSTDYISLGSGDNEITIRRSGREQVLKIERK